MSSSHFSEIKKYLCNLRKADVAVFEETDCLIRFRITDLQSNTVKHFTIHYCDSSEGAESLNRERPMYHYYYLQFEQELVPFNDGDLGTITEWKWYPYEDDVLARVKELRRRYNR